MAHREGIRAYLKDVILSGLVVDWGCGTKPMNNYIAGNFEFIGIDKLNHVGADVVVDLEKDMENRWQADFAFCIEVLEHIWNSKTLLRNIYNNLKKGGVLYLSQPFLYEVHKEDDRIRYTYHGLEQLLSEIGFTVVDVQPTVGHLDTAEGYVLKATK